MKPLRRLCAAFVLTLMLALSAFAGEMTTGVTQPPPPQQATTEGQVDTPPLVGQMDTTVTATDSVTQAALSLLETALSLF